MSTIVHMSKTYSIVNVSVNDREYLDSSLDVIMKGLEDIYCKFNFDNNNGNRKRVDNLIKKSLEVPEGALLLAKADQGIIGYSFSGKRVNEITGLNYPFIYALWVHPDWRAKYVGVRLLGKTIQLLEERGFNMMAAQVNYNNKIKETFAPRFKFEPNSLIYTLSIANKKENEIDS
ncbi:MULTISPECIES: GNAT family N-acetyltransferase [Bacillus]|uniref:GNAT family N-acetyltransferase n=1 Tax=Bacillus TaxID=1386 RepID=UPI00245321F4|nr:MULTISPECIES: GNAT family N-acetyltransferase [Bacillus]MDH3081268.1 GNAT family N-acetyltransferase [Bacillus amyloliquefaciens]MDU0074645.1 GNAT family N-acetyltransferase [Bacillus sp. IG2]MDU0100355.1 GNAT family N-acetyltransferase [Bacillus sp. IS1]MEC2272982.1 GNAT family N-acetyltransferase [Bacillus velezensis]MED3677451.1 GNAT family N-acetyltransferase [Bacillus velezensis]